MDLWRETNKLQSVDDTTTENWWSVIVNHYGEPQRHYHTMTHIEDMLHMFEEYKGKLKDISAVFFAIVFHDIIYDPKSPDNEGKSAELFEEYAKEAKLEQNLIQSVKEWILETKRHTTPEHSLCNPTAISDLHYVLDFDMAVLARPKAEYEKYTEEIRQEYIHIPDTDFKERRAKVLKTFLTTPYIYATPEFRNKCEGPARENIRREISYLTDK